MSAAPELTRIAPPGLPEELLTPFVSTTPEIVVPVPKTSTTRSVPPALIVVAAAPGCFAAPVIVIGRRRSKSPLVSLLPDASRYVPAGTTIVAPVVLFASCTAARNVHAPPAAAQTPLSVASGRSAVLFTVNVEAAVAGEAPNTGMPTASSRASASARLARLPAHRIFGPPGDPA